MGNKKYKPRRDYFIKKWLQFKFSLVFVAVIIAGNTIFGAYIYNEIKKNLRHYLYTSHTRLSNTWEIIEKVVIESSLWSIVIFFFIFLIVIYLITKRLTKRFHIIFNDLRLLKSGDLTGKCDVSSPASDTVKKLTNSYGELKTYLRTNINEIKGNITKLNAALDKLESCANDKDKEGVGASLEELESCYNKVQSNINKINI
jgi:methyl-accepting chemotaxis protein